MVCLCNFTHGLLKYVALLFSCIVIVKATTQEQSLKLFLLSFIIAIIFSVRAQVCHIDSVEVQLVHHYLASLNVDALFIRHGNLSDHISEPALNWSQ